MPEIEEDTNVKKSTVRKVLAFTGTAVGFLLAGVLVSKVLAPEAEVIEYEPLEDGSVVDETVTSVV